MNVVLRLKEAAVGFLWWGGWVVGFAKSFSCQVVLCCVVVGVVTIQLIFKNWDQKTPRNWPGAKGFFSFF